MLAVFNFIAINILILLNPVHSSRRQCEWFSVQSDSEDELYGYRHYELCTHGCCHTDRYPCCDETTDLSGAFIGAITLGVFIFFLIMVFVLVALSKRLQRARNSCTTTVHYHGNEDRPPVFTTSRGHSPITSYAQSPPTYEEVMASACSSSHPEKS